MTNHERTELLAMVRRAKSSHIRWRAYAQGLVSGIAVDEEKLPVKHTDCRFGRWYFGHGMKELGHLDIFKDVQGPHEMLHALYEQIHRMVGEKQFSEAETKLHQLTGISRTLLEQLELLEAEIDAVRRNPED